MNSVDFGKLKKYLNTQELYGCDCTVANLFLQQEKCKLELKIHDDVLFRYYVKDDLIYGYGFPLSLKNDASDLWLKNALDYIIEDSLVQKRQLQFCLVTKNQKDSLDLYLSKYFNRRINWKTSRADSDYLYLTKNLSELPGAAYQKKRNHISRFERIYKERWTFRTFPENDIAADIIEVSKKWFEENDGNSSDSLMAEQKNISLILENAELFGIKGGALYVDEKPVAMTLASEISDKVLDVLFEKAIDEYAKNGAYAVINRQFANTSTGYLYCNREEDLGIEGLRKAKLSYKPDILLEKFYGTVTG